MGRDDREIGKERTRSEVMLGRVARDGAKRKRNCLVFKTSQNTLSLLS